MDRNSRIYSRKRKTKMIDLIYIVGIVVAVYCAVDYIKGE